jgi:hypothetical protein
MATIATLLVFLAAAAAVASWIVGAVSYARCLRSLGGSGQRGLMWRAMLAWPFVLKHLQGAPAEYARRTNKALVAFFASLMVLAAAASVATNLNRISS